MFEWFFVEESESPYRLRDWLNTLPGTKVDGLQGVGVVDQVGEWQIVLSTSDRTESYIAFVHCMCKKLKPVVK